MGYGCVRVRLTCINRSSTAARMPTDQLERFACIKPTQTARTKGILIELGSPPPFFFCFFFPHCYSRHRDLPIRFSSAGEKVTRCWGKSRALGI